MKHSWKRAAVGAALILTAGFALSACGDDDDTSSGGGRGSDGDAALTKANFAGRVIEAQTDVGSSRFEFTMDADGMEMTGTGALSIGEDVDDTAMEMTMSSPMGEMEYVIVDGTMYMNMGPLTEGKYVEMDLDGLMGEDMSSMIEQMDPTAQFEMYEEAVIEFEQDGDAEEINGVEATPYRLVLDTEKVMELAGEELGQDPSELDGVDMPETLEYTIYLGEDELPYRIVMDMMGMTMTMDYYDWGEDVTIEAPSPEEITDADPFSLEPAA